MLAIYADPTLDTKPELLGQRGGAFYSAGGRRSGRLAALRRWGHPLGERNEGHLPFLPNDAMIEASCRVDKQGARPIPTAPLGRSLSGLIGHVSGYEELVVAAAVHGQRSRVYQAMMAHPLIGQHDLATQLTDKLLAANAAHLTWI